MDVSVAGLPLCVESADAAYFARRFAEYRREDGCTPEMTLRTRREAVIAEPQGKLLQVVNGVHIRRLPDGRMCRYAYSVGENRTRGPIRFAITATPEYTQVDIRLLETYRHPVFSLTDLEYMYTGDAFHNRICTLGGGVLHASAIAYNGQGVAFSAPSGTGKSTHAALWRERFGDAVTAVNDDKPAIRFDGEQAMLYGTPWSGKTAQNHNIAVPLRAIVVIERGEKNAIRRLDTVEAMFHLTTQINRPYYDEALGLRTLDFTERLLGAVPVYCLTCDISHAAVDTAFRAIFSQEGTR